MQNAAVHQLEFVADRFALIEALELIALVTLDIQRSLAHVDPIAEYLVDRGSGLLQCLRQAVHFRVAAIADDQALVLIEHAQAVIQIIECDIETLMLLGERGFRALARGDVPGVVTQPPFGIGSTLIWIVRPSWRSKLGVHSFGAGRMLFQVALERFKIQRSLASRNPMLDDLIQRRSGAGQAFGKPVHRGELTIANDETLLRVEHAKTVRHVVQGGIEAAHLFGEGLFPHARVR